MLKKIIVGFIAFLTLISVFVTLLFFGININSFSLFNLDISKLYIKLDKKLIVKIDSIEFSTQSVGKAGKEDIKNILSSMDILPTYFQRVDIKSLKIKNNNFSVLFEENMVSIDSKIFYLDAKYKILESKIELDIASFKMKKENIAIKGVLNLNYKKEIANFFGTYSHKKIEGDLNFKVTEQYIDFFLTSNNISNLHFLKSFFRLPVVAEEWMYDNVTGEMKLNYLYGRLDTKTLKPIMSSLKGDATITNATIYFNKQVSPVKTKKLSIIFENGTLYFKMLKPMYKNISLNGSSVKIPNLISKKGRVLITIKATHILDKNVLDILSAYNINVPVIQLDGETKANLFLDVPYKGGVKVDGTFNVKDSNLLLKSFPFYTKTATVLLKNHNVIVDSPSVKHDTMIDTKLHLNINVKTSTATGDVFINSFLIKKDKDNTIHLKNVASPLFVDFNKETMIDLKKLDTKIFIKKDFTQIDISSLDFIYPYSDLLKKINVKKGKLSLQINSGNDIYIDTEVHELNIPIKRDGKYIRILNLTGSLKNNTLNLASKNKDFIIKSKNSKLSLELTNLDVVYDTKNKDKSSLYENLNLRLIKSNITIDNQSFFSKNSLIKLDKSGIDIKGIFQTLEFPFLHKGKKIFEYDVVGSYKNDIFNISTLDKRIKVNMANDVVDVNIKDIDLEYNTNNNSKETFNLVLKGNNSNIIINKKYKLLSNIYKVSASKNKIIFDLQYKKSKINFIKNKDNQISLKANDMSAKMINRFFDKTLLEGGSVSLDASGTTYLLDGKLIFNKNKILDLAVLNNIITIVNTTPALIDPFLAIPAIFGMVKNGGFSTAGYVVNEGHIDFVFNMKKQFLNMYDILTIGNSVDFTGNATLDFNKNLIDANVELIFMKNYTFFVEHIPLVNYLLLGDQKAISTSISIRGLISEPEIESHMLRDTANIPFNILKRIIDLPIDILTNDNNK